MLFIHILDLIIFWGLRAEVPGSKNTNNPFINSLPPIGLPLIKTVLTPLAKNVLLPADMSAADAAIQKKIDG